MLPLHECLQGGLSDLSEALGKLTSKLADKDEGTVVKKVILYGNHAYLWSTENGYEFFVEQSLTINEENYQKINDLLETYGTDRLTEDIISPVQRGKDTKTRGSSSLDALKRAGNKRYTETNRLYSRQQEQTSDRAGINEYNFSNTQGETIRGRNIGSGSASTYHKGYTSRDIFCNKILKERQINRYLCVKLIPKKPVVPMPLNCG